MEKNNQKGKKGCLFLLLGTLGVLVGTLVYILVSGWISAAVIEAAIGGKVAYALLTASLPCIIVVFVLLDGILLLNYLPSAEPSDPDEMSPMLGRRKAQGLSPKLVRGLSIALASATVLVALVSAGTYRTVSKEGVSTTVCFIKVEDYRWEQVSSYEVACDNDRGLSMTFTMRDGKRFEILQNTMSAPTSFKEIHDCKEAFAVKIMERMEELQVPCESFESTSNHRKLMESARTFYKDDPQLWPFIKQLIRYEEVGVTQGS